MGVRLKWDVNMPAAIFSECLKSLHEAKQHIVAVWETLHFCTQISVNPIVSLETTRSHTHYVFPPSCFFLSCIFFFSLHNISGTAFTFNSQRSWGRIWGRFSTQLPIHLSTHLWLTAEPHRAVETHTLLHLCFFSYCGHVNVVNVSAPEHSNRGWLDSSLDCWGVSVWPRQYSQVRHEVWREGTASSPYMRGKK